MKQLLSFFMAAMLLPMLLGAQELAPNQKLLGHYTTDDITLGGCWGMSLITGVRPIATDLTSDELAFFQGSKIVGFRVGLSQSTPVTRVFVIPIDGNGNLLTETEWSCDVSDEGWNVVTLDDPYLIDLPEGYGLRIGFDYEQTRTNKPISAVKVGTVYPTYIYRNNNWVNYGVNTMGNVSLQVICENDNFPAYAIRVRNLQGKSTIKIGDPLQMNFQACNMGINQVAAGDCTFNLAIDGEFVGTATNPTALTANYGDIPFTVSTTDLSVGQHTLTVTVATANGDVIENPMSLSHTFATFEFGFSRQMRLVEQFTSTYCTFCPNGSSMLSTLSNMRGDIAWVAVHQNMGSTDIYRTAQCDTIANLQGCDGYPEGSFDRFGGWEGNPSQVCTVINYGSGNAAYEAGATETSNFLDTKSEIPSWATVNINSTYDEATREAVITIDGQLVPNFEEMMGPDSKLTVYITEDNLISYQTSGGNDYVHNNVLRRALGSVRGVEIHKTGNSYKNQFTVSIPEAWKSEDLNIVAFISRPLGNPLNDIYVTNCNKRKLGEFDEPTVLRGDVNGDGRVTIDDLSKLIDYLLSEDATGLNVAALDCNLSGTVTIDDVSSLIDYLLNEVWP